MLSLGGFFLALFLGDVILGWGQSQPVGVTDCKDMSERSFRALSGTSHYPSCFWKHQKKDVETAARPWLYWWMKHRLKKKKKKFSNAGWAWEDSFFLLCTLSFNTNTLLIKRKLNYFWTILWSGDVFFYFILHTHTHIQTRPINHIRLI